MEGQKMKKLTVWVMLGAGIVSFLLFLNIGRGIAFEAKLVKIVPLAEGAGFYVDPPTINIKMDTVVVWLNGVRDKELKVVFQEGKTCMDVTANPNPDQPGFYLDADSCYVTSFVPYAATTMLQFPKMGTFDYKVVTKDGQTQAKGSIIVTE